MNRIIILLILLLLGFDLIVIGQNNFRFTPELSNNEYDKEYDSISQLPNSLPEALCQALDSSFKKYKKYIHPTEIITFITPYQKIMMIKTKYFEYNNKPSVYVRYNLIIPGKGYNKYDKLYYFDVTIRENGSLLEPIKLPGNNIDPANILSYKQALRKTFGRWNNPLRRKHGFLKYNKELNSFCWRFTNKIRRLHSTNNSKYVKLWLSQTIEVEAFSGELKSNKKHEVQEIFCEE